MKRLFSIITALSMLLSLAACGSQSNGGADSTTAGSERATESSTVNSSESDSEQASTSEAEAGGAKALVVYFSATGTTKAVAEEIARAQGADIYEIVPSQPYTDADLNYSNRSSRSTVEQNDDSARPEISRGVENLSSYDVIYVGYPIWWGDMPRILYTFFDSYDLSGKTIAPFCTSGGSGLSGTPRSIASLEPGATVTDGLHIGSSSASGASSAVSQWLTDIGLAG